ncbi:MAG: hypothetical protein AB8C95_07745 [Phycisphaeraceae bacterium]
MGLVKLGGVICLAAVVFGSICMTVVATMGDGEDPPKIFEQMVAVSTGVFVLGMIISLIGVIIYVNQPEPPKPTLASSLGSSAFEEDDDSTEEEQADREKEKQKDALLEQADPNKPDPYASDHRRREF